MTEIPLLRLVTSALLRLRATSEKESSVRKMLIAEADRCSVKAAEIAKRRKDRLKL